MDKSQMKQSGSIPSNFIKNVMVPLTNNNEIQKIIVNELASRVYKIEDSMELNSIKELEQLCESRKWKMPKYELFEECDGRTYTVSAECSVMLWTVRAEALTTKEAKRQAAMKMYRKIKNVTSDNVPLEYESQQVRPNNENIIDTEGFSSYPSTMRKTSFPIKKNYPKNAINMQLHFNWIGALQELCMYYKWILPMYEFFIEVDGESITYSIECTVNTQRVRAKGPTKKKTKQQAAMKMYHKLKNITCDNVSWKCETQQGQQVHPNNEPTEHIDYQSIDMRKNYPKDATDIQFQLDLINALQTLCIYRKWMLPKYKIFVERNDRLHTYSVECTIEAWTVRATALTEKEAKRRAAMKMYHIVKNLTGDNIPLEYEVQQSHLINEPTTNIDDNMGYQSTTIKTLIDIKKNEKENAIDLQLHVNSICALQELCNYLQLRLPTYTFFVKGNGSFPFIYSVECAIMKWSVKAEALKKKEAKRQAAMKMFHIVKNFTRDDIPLKYEVQQAHSNNEATENIDDQSTMRNPLIDIKNNRAENAMYSILKTNSTCALYNLSVTCEWMWPKYKVFNENDCINYTFWVESTGMAWTVRAQGMRENDSEQKVTKIMYCEVKNVSKTNISLEEVKNVPETKLKGNGIFDHACAELDEESAITAVVNVILLTLNDDTKFAKANQFPMFKMPKEVNLPSLIERDTVHLLMATEFPDYNKNYGPSVNEMADSFDNACNLANLLKLRNNLHGTNLRN